MSIEQENIKKTPPTFLRVFDFVSNKHPYPLSVLFVDLFHG